MSDTGNKLEVRTISEIKGVFRIPSYQRGYRWEKRQVEQLLDDLVSHAENRKDKDLPYYLQPIVIAPVPKDEINLQEMVDIMNGKETYDYDLIDGQQRLTTILLILKSLEKAKKIDYSIIGELFKSNQDEAKALTTMAGNLEKIDITIPFQIIYQTRADTRGFPQ